MASLAKRQDVAEPLGSGVTEAHILQDEDIHHREN